MAKKQTVAPDDVTFTESDSNLFEDQKDQALQVEDVVDDSDLDQEGDKQAEFIPKTLDKVTSADTIVVEIDRKDGQAKGGFITIEQHVPIGFINALEPVKDKPLEFSKGTIRAIGYLENGEGEVIKF